MRQRHTHTVLLLDGDSSVRSPVICPRIQTGLTQQGSGGLFLLSNTSDTALALKNL